MKDDVDYVLHIHISPPGRSAETVLDPISVSTMENSAQPLTQETVTMPETSSIRSSTFPQVESGAPSEDLMESGPSSMRSSMSPDVESGVATENIRGSCQSSDNVVESHKHQDEKSGDVVHKLISSPHRMSTAMEDFLTSMVSDDGGNRTALFMEGHHQITSGAESIFETSFDLTEERLRRLFNLFDKDHSETITYDEMKNGLKYHGLGSFAEDEPTFDQLMRHLDKDNSGNVTFEEFSEGIRLLMLRSLLQSAIATHGNEKNLGIDDAVVTEIIDYNPTRLERSVLEGLGQDTTEIIPSSSVTRLNVIDFFFSDRPKWIDVRWINITGTLLVSMM
jgi:hypothetical protein